MHRMTYRNFGTQEALLLNHTVDAGGGRAGIRWYEVRDPGGAAAIDQQGTYAPADGNSRWMGSIAMDHIGNVALGYSISGPSLYPSIRYAGRLVDDPAGELPPGESSIVEGGGAQTGSLRWGDYSSMNLDPVDDCTFWYTQEYYASTGSSNWQSRIASFRFPNCANGPTGSLRGTVRDAVSSNPIAQCAFVDLSGDRPADRVQFADRRLHLHPPDRCVHADSFCLRLCAGYSIARDHHDQPDDVAKCAVESQRYARDLWLCDGRPCGRSAVCDDHAHRHAVQSAVKMDHNQSRHRLLQRHAGGRPACTL